MNTVSRIKPIATHSLLTPGLLTSALLAIGLALSPAASMADGDSHSHGRVERDGGSHHGDHDRGEDRRHNGAGKPFRGHDRGHGEKHEKGRAHKGRYEVYKPHLHEQYVYHLPAHERPVETIIYGYPVRTHTRTYIETPEYDSLRLLLGLHFDNIDVIFRD